MKEPLVYVIFGYRYWYVVLCLPECRLIIKLNSWNVYKI